MKKLLLLAAFAFAATPVLAQNANPDYVPGQSKPAPPSTPTITPVDGGVSGNYADLDQSGNSNDGTIDQNGTSDSDARLIQNGGDTATITQSGAGQNAFLEQLGSADGAAFIEQDAVGGTAGTGGNIAYMRIDNNANTGSSAESFIDQSGSNNTGYIEVRFVQGGNYARQTQTGDNNEAYLYNDNPNPNDGTDIEQIRQSDQIQVGDDNFAMIASGGNQYGFVARQEQIGSDNEAVIDGLEQRGYGDQYQSGDNNHATFSTTSITRDIDLDMEQIGNNNTAVAEGWGGSGSNSCGSQGSASCMNIRTNQVGDNNEIFANANGNDGNEIDVDQYGGGSGTFNQAVIEFNADNADVVIDQGSPTLNVLNNVADVVVGTDNSLATVNQQGDLNTATINQ